MDVIPETCRAH